MTSADEWENPSYKKRYEENRMHAINHISRKTKYKKTGKRISFLKIKCDYCSKLIRKKPSQIRYYKHHFCNRKHHDRYRKNRKIVHKNKNKLFRDFTFGKSEAKK